MPSAPEIQIDLADFTAQWLADLRTSFPGWAFFYDGDRTWTAMRGRTATVTATSPLVLRAHLEARR
ncbi:hypothetical protein DPM19_08930 [Actinomadura craniellae]|uniref:Uncharacterized protein n=1 Tax=Actinomadura craniellae TaxID=2231787 RepID=A0A365HA30_9ACTN|nr:hypothetical protein [Actinomadura craniellae]RAY15872.1 hypothetical protein DPM19_08930 [Actinomadura craniellae]